MNAGSVSSFTYDANGNPASITDANHHTIAYTNDNMDRRSSRTDALLRTESISYDPNGNIAAVIDRKGQVTAFVYDGRQCPKVANFPQTAPAGNKPASLVARSTSRCGRKRKHQRQGSRLQTC